MSSHLARVGSKTSRSRGRPLLGTGWYTDSTFLITCLKGFPIVTGFDCNNNTYERRVAISQIYKYQGVKNFTLVARYEISSSISGDSNTKETVHIISLEPIRKKQSPKSIH